MNKNKTTQFFLARHGETEWNKIRRLQGHLDSELTLNGIEQAKQLGKRMQQHNLMKIIVSPLKRALHTAQLCQQQIKIKLEINQQLVERHFGTWQSCYFDELTEEENFESVFFQVNHIAPPQGESGIACGERIKNALITIAKKQQCSKILIVTHGDAIRCLLALLLQQSECDAYSQYGNGRVFPVEYCHQHHLLTVK